HVRSVDLARACGQAITEHRVRDPARRRVGPWMLIAHLVQVGRRPAVALLRPDTAAEAHLAADREQRKRPVPGSHAAFELGESAEAADREACVEEVEEADVEADL